MHQEQYSYVYPLDTHFPERRFVWGWEGGGLFACDQASRYYLIVDEGTLAEFLRESDPADARILQRLITVITFDAEDERREHLNDFILQSMGYELMQETEEEKTYRASAFEHTVTIPRRREITQEMARSIQREWRERSKGS